MKAYYDRESTVVVNGVSTSMVEVTLERTPRGKRIPYQDFDTVAWCPTVAAAKLVADALNKRNKRSTPRGCRCCGATGSVLQMCRKDGKRRVVCNACRLLQ